MLSTAAIAFRDSPPSSLATRTASCRPACATSKAASAARTSSLWSRRLCIAGDWDSSGFAFGAAPEARSTPRTQITLEPTA